MTLFAVAGWACLLLAGLATQLPPNLDAAGIPTAQQEAVAQITGAIFAAVGLILFAICRAVRELSRSDKP